MRDPPPACPPATRTCLPSQHLPSTRIGTGLAAHVGAQCHRLSMRGQLCLTPVMITPRCDPGMKQMRGTWRWPG